MSGGNVFATLMLARALAADRPEVEPVPEPAWTPALTSAERCRIYLADRDVRQAKEAGAPGAPPELAVPTRPR
jgi:hypothetical protein